MKKIIALTILATIMTGCSNSDIYSGDVYTADQAKQVQHVSYGTVVSVRAVKIQANSNGNNQNVIGALGGAVLGGVLGNTVGGGTGRVLATATGAIGGAVVGNAIENKANQANAVELEIRPKNSDSNIVIIQKGSVKNFYVGQPVRLVTNGKRISASPRYD